MIRTFVFASALLLTPGICNGQINDGSGKWFNPLGAFQSDSAPMVAQTETIEKEPSSYSFKPPKWLNPVEIGRSTKAGVQKVAAGTKKVFIETADFLNPFDNKSLPKSRFQLSSQGYKPQAMEEPKSKFKWFWQKEQEEEPETVNGWLSQPNPLSYGRPMTR